MPQQQRMLRRAPMMMAMPMMMMARRGAQNVDKENMEMEELELIKRLKNT
jgi:hypothetical protein